MTREELYSQLKFINKNLKDYYVNEMAVTAVHSTNNLANTICFNPYYIENGKEKFDFDLLLQTGQTPIYIYLFDCVSKVQRYFKGELHINIPTNRVLSLRDFEFTLLSEDVELKNERNWEVINIVEFPNYFESSFYTLLGKQRYPINYEDLIACLIVE